MEPADKEKTAIITPDGLFQYTVMPFGLCNSSSTFQRLMDRILKHLKWTSVLVYLDDIVVLAVPLKNISKDLKKYSNA